MTVEATNILVAQCTIAFCVAIVVFLGTLAVYTLDQDRREKKLNRPPAHPQETHVVCPVCFGDGKLIGPTIYMCTRCGGRGYITKEPGTY